MSETAAGAAAFNARTIAAVIAAGVIGFVLFLVLTAYAGDLQGGRGDPRAHALSKSAVGFRGLVRLIELGGGSARLVRSEEGQGTEDLLVLTLEPRTDPTRLAALLNRRRNLPTLIILPKWSVARDRERPDWVRRAGRIPPPFVQELLGGLAGISLAQRQAPSSSVAGLDTLRAYRAPAPAIVQSASGTRLTPLIVAGDKDTVLLARVGAAPHYLLSEPDLLNNQGLRNAEAASGALAILSEINSTRARTVSFDLTLNGFGEEQSALKLAFDPPFLPLTVALFVAALLAGLHGWARFGAAAEEGRAIAFGKSQLVENSAGLLKLARREHSAGRPYAELVREAAAYDSGAHLALRDAELDAYLDRVSPPDRPPFSALAAEARRAASGPDLLAAARALFQWKKDLIR